MKSFYKNSKEDEMILKLKSLEVNPPSGLWNDIESSLKIRKHKRIILITSWASAATIALLFSIGGYFTLQKEVKNQTQVKTLNNNILNQSSTTTKKNIPENSSKPTQKVEVEKSRSIVTKSYSQTTDSSNTIIKERELGNSNILAKNFKNVQVKLGEKGVVKEKLQLPPSNEDRKSTILALSDNNVAKQRGSWYISASGFPVYSYHSAGVTNKIGTERQTGIVSFGGSILVRYEFANRISIESGLLLGFMGQKEKNLYLSNSDNNGLTILSRKEYTNNYGTLVTSNSNYSIVDAQDKNRLSFDVESNLNKIAVDQKFRYLEIPLIISKKFNLKKVYLFVKGGLTAGFMIQNQLDLEGSNIHLKGKTTGVEKFLATATSSIGFSIPILQRVNIIVEPTLKLGLKPLKNSDTKSYPFSSFIKFGVEIPI